jgi:hypothetical protein
MVLGTSPPIVRHRITVVATVGTITTPSAVIKNHLNFVLIVINTIRQGKARSD